MSKLVKEPCPQCGKDVEVTLPEAGETAGIPNFCGWCGARLYSSCPSCGVALTHLFGFCPECRNKLVEEAPPRAAAPPPEAAPPPAVPEPESVAQLRRDLAEVEPFWRSAVDVLIKLNPVTFRGSRFSECLVHVTAETSPAQDSMTLQRALEAGDLSNIAESLDRYAEAAVRAVRDLTTGWYPPLQEAHSLQAGVSVSPALLADLSTAIRSQQKLVQELRSGFLDLKNGLPRFQEIAGKSRFWQFIVDLTVSTTLGAIGLDGVSLTRGLREAMGKSDQEYLQAYQESLSKVVAAWNGVSEQMAQAAAPAIDAIFSSLHTRIEQTLRELARVAASGTDVAPAVGRLQLVWQPVEVWEEIFASMILDEMKSRGAVESALDRLQELFAKGRPWPIEKWPELELLAETTVQMSREAFLRAKILEILGSGFPDCHIAPDIPEAKLQKAVAAYAHAVDPSRVMFLYDDTVFGGAKEGFCLTADELFWHDLGLPVHGRALKGISTIRSGEGSAIRIDGDALQVTTAGRKEKMLAVLLAARDQARSPESQAELVKKALLGKMVTAQAAQAPALAGAAA